MGWFRETFAALAIREYRMLWTGSMFATTAYMMSFMLVPAVAFDITGNNTSAGIAQMGSGIGMFLIGPLGGVIADRLPKKPLVLAGQFVPGLVILGIGLLIISGAVSIALLTLGTAIMGLGFAFMGPARQAWVAELVPRKLLPNAVALSQIALTTSQVLGPLFIAILVGSWVGVGGTYLFMASLFVVVLPLTALLPNTPPAMRRDQRSTIRAELREGFTYLWGDPKLRLLWASFLAMIVCGFAFQTLLPGLLDTELGREPTDVGEIFLSFAIAGLLANLLLAGIVRGPLAWPVMLIAGLVMCGGFLLLAAASSYALVLLAAAPIGAGRSGYWLINNSLMMTNARPEFYGRVMALAMMGFSVQALLSPVWGAMADSIGIRETLVVVAIFGAASIALASLSWLRIRRPSPTPLPTTQDASG